MNAALELASPTSRILLADSASEMPRFYAFIDELCDQHNYPSNFRMEVQLALEEVLTNVISYAHPQGSGSHRIELLFFKQDDGGAFVVIDDGVPFDPTQQPPVDIEAPIAQRNVGGLGIHMVRHLMDSMEYHRSKDHNVLTLRKKVSSLS